MIDEPDVHLHPDLQARMGKLIISMLEEYKDQINQVYVCIATHSVPLVCALAASEYTSIGNKTFDLNHIALSLANDELRKMGPFAGHPLSLILNDDAALIVEGDDDERVWQQAVRSSKGQIKLFPIVATSVDQQSELEQFATKLVTSLYDNPILFSIRDGDGKGREPLTHIFPLRRYRLNCYSIENLLLTDQCMNVMAISWEEFIKKSENWLEKNNAHKDAPVIRLLIACPDRLRYKNIKDIRTLVCSIAGSAKPWEVIVGKALSTVNEGDFEEGNMMISFIGEAALKALVLRQF